MARVRRATTRFFVCTLAHALLSQNNQNNQRVSTGVLARAHGVCVSRACVRVCLRPCAGSAAAHGGLRERVGGRFRGKGGWAWCGQPAGADDDPCTARKWAAWRSSCEGSVGGVGEVGATCPDEGHQGPVQSLAAERVSVTARVHACRLDIQASRARRVIACALCVESSRGRGGSCWWGAGGVAFCRGFWVWARIGVRYWAATGMHLAG